jgi:hypothetical protein
MHYLNQKKKEKNMSRRRERKEEKKEIRMGKKEKGIHGR